MPRLGAQSMRNEPLNNCLKAIPDTVDRVLLAFSGGLDSCVLLHLLAAHNSRNFELKLWHINHGLQQQANEMESFCVQLANRYKIDIKISHLNLGPLESNVEARARNARYALFEDYLSDKDCLLTAHHADDQAETLMLNILRGSGTAGLRGIAKSRVIARARLIRPLLDISRETLLEYAITNQLNWFDDPSNATERFDRNYLRHQVMPLIKNRWPAYLESMRNVCAIQDETQQVLDELAQLDYAQARDCNYWYNQNSKTILNIPKLLGLSRARQKNLIRYWLRTNGCPILPRARLEVLTELLNARQDAAPVIQSCDYDIRIYAGCLFIVDPNQGLMPKASYDFDCHTQVHIDELNLALRRCQVLKHFDETDNGQLLTIKFRSETNAASQYSHRLKRLFQKYKIPPWQRAYVPQVYLDDNLTGLWVPDSRGFD